MNLTIQDLQNIYNILTSDRLKVPGNEIMGTASLIERMSQVLMTPQNGTGEIPEEVSEAEKSGD